MNFTIATPLNFRTQRIVSLLLALVVAVLIFGSSRLSSFADSSDAEQSPMAQSAQITTNLAGDYNGTLIITAPANIGVIDLAMALEANGDDASGTVLEPSTTHFSGSPAITAMITGHINGITPTFTIQSETFVETISGQMVSRVFSIEGEVWDNGTTLSGHYTEIVTGYTPTPLQLDGQILLSKSTLVIAQTPASFLSLQADMASLSLNGNTTITAKLLNSNLQPVSGVTSLSFSSNLGTVTPETVETDSNGVATVIFNSGGTAGQALISAQTDSASGSTLILIQGQILSLQADATTVPLNGVTTITARLTDNNFQPFAQSTSINFSSDLGTIAPTTANTDSDGYATATFSAGGASGLATITVQAEGASNSMSITIEGDSTSPGNYKIYLPSVTR